LQEDDTTKDGEDYLYMTKSENPSTGGILETNDPIPLFLKTLIVGTSQGLRFSKYEILRRLDLLKFLGQSVARLTSEDTTTLCALAMSGIPIGVAVAHYLGRPLVFYNRDAWDDDPAYGEQKILPLPSHNSTVAILDTHRRSGNTAAQCARYLHERFDCNVNQMIYPFDWQLVADTLPRIQYRSLGSLTQYSEVVCGLLGTPDLAEARRQYLSVDSDFWEFTIPQRELRETKLSKAGRLWGKPGIIPAPKRTSEAIRAKVRKQIPRVMWGGWELLRNPLLIRDCVHEFNRVVDFSGIDVLIGIEALGAAFAIHFALETDFAGDLFIFKNEVGLLPTVSDLSNKTVILMQVTLETGRFAVEAVDTVQQLGGKVSKLLAVQTKFGTLPLSLGKLSLRKLRQEGIEIVAID
jgi:adenine/guanine phosphoribosyltransferase-like PRPP-binding protein